MGDVLKFDDLPDTIRNEDELEELLSQPPAWLAAQLSKADGDIIVLGVAGKVGPTLARMAKRAAPDKRVIGVARFSDADVKDRQESWGVETIACDLLDRDTVAALPDVPNVVYMAGNKFGTDEDRSFAWAMNTHVPALVAERFAKSRIVVFSTL